MTKATTIGVIAGLVVGLLVGSLWWWSPYQRVQQDLVTLQGQQAAAEVAREQLKASELRLKQVEEELRLERERRASLETILSQGRK